MKKNKIFILITAVFITSIFYFYNRTDIKNAEKAVLLTEKGNINLEIARTEYERRLGLMFRKELCQNCGMIFVFEEEDQKTFWMKNTYIPLDIIFLSKNMRINDIFENVSSTNEKTSDKDIPMVSS
ncbi:MAG: DUF192 domain-containing protein, partial [Elusimicrobiales bacterium]|nr:DUF192 domain-containing protein [Elusimicrobiales bacterium]